MPPTHRSTTLRHLARAVGVAVEYHASGSAHRPEDATLRSVLTAMGYRCHDDRTAAQALRAVRRSPWTRPIDPVAVVWRPAGPAERGQRDPDPRHRGGMGVHVTLSAQDGVPPRLRLTLEDGEARRLPAVRWGGRYEADGSVRRRGAVRLPEDLPLGYHRLDVDDGTATATCVVIVAPDRVPAIGDTRRWGWMLQLYAVRSTAGWGQGEYRDLGDLAAWSARDGADFLLINPVHASAPATPRQASPYSPTSRRFFDPCYLHVPEVDGYASLPVDERERLSLLPPALRCDAERIDRDAVWAAKRAALWAAFTRCDDAARADLAAWRQRGGQSLERFATFSGIAEQHGVPCTSWPRPLRDPRAPAVARWVDAHEELVAFHAWLQLHCVRQLRRAQERATDAGMAIGVVHDLAVGVDAGGADVWALPDEFARSARVGAPPDAFNQQGQDWGQPPPLPQAMRAHGYRTQREMLAAAFTAGGGLRIDHILGLSRLFWIPEEGGPADGTYVSYPADEQFAVLALEAQRADAIVVGEDLGTVDDRVRQLMRRRRIAGSAVLYFEVEGGRRRRSDEYPRNALASATTHDLPPATGWWDGSTLELRRELGLLTQPYDVAAAALADDQATMLKLLTADGALEPGATDVRARVLAMYRFLSSTPSLLVAVALWDAVGDARPPNVPGTVEAYPNWRLPLAVGLPDGVRPVTVEQLTAGLAAVAQMVDAVHDRRATSGHGTDCAAAGQPSGIRHIP